LKKYLAFDLGASSGRAIVGILKNGILKLDEIYRFPNSGIQVFNSMYWDILWVFQEIKNGILTYVKKYGSELDSIGIDTWGVDFVLLNERDELAGPVHTYRDNRTNGMLQKMFEKVPEEEIFNQTGIQFMPINTSTQIFSMVYNNCPELEITKTFLMLPDYFNFLLSGVKCSEYSDVTTSQLFNPIKDNWAYDLIEKLGFKKQWFCKIKEPGTILGPIQKEIAEETGISPNTQIIAPLCHDTGSAVAAIPVDRENVKQREWAYISSGTWSLLGVELEKPLINEKAMQYNYTNEGGINKTSRFLKNLTGLWLIQECKRLWNKNDMNLKWDEIEKQAKSAPPFKFFINPNDLCFLNPQNMIDEIKNYCKIHNQNIPEKIGEIARTVYESMAFNYKNALMNLEDILEKKIKIVHIIGGGSRDNLLNQFTANALNVPVIAGPAEATAIGNVLVQALALGEIKNLNELKIIIRNSFQIKEYFPNNVDEWNKNYEIFLGKTLLNY
jgi:rhamnulokinase